MIKQILLCLSLTLPAITAVHAATAPDLKGWVVKGAAQMDPAKPGPDGAPSIKLGPDSEAMLTLRPEDGSGKISFSIYDDGTVAVPDQKKSAGPRWGFTEANGRVFVGGIMYAKFLKPEGSICLIDADPKDKGAWLAMKFAGARGAAGWKKWEFEFDPAAGLKISVDGTPVPAKYFDWNASQVTGFNGLALYGDATKSATPQTVWVSGITYELGGPMTAKPAGASAAAPATPAATGAAGTNPPAPAAATGPNPLATVAIQSVVPTGPPSTLAPITPWDSKPYTPGPTLADDLKNTTVPLRPDYASGHPRLLFSGTDRAALQAKAKDNPALWDNVLASARAVTSPGALQTAEVITNGSKYWKVEGVESGALAWFVTGDPKYRDGTIRWMLAYAQQPVWGTLFRPNLDLAASWYLYHVSIAYDILYPDMTDADRKTIQNGLSLHAKAIYDDLNTAGARDKIPFDQNHTYIPTVALTAAALALVGDVPEATDWLKRSYAVLNRCRYVLPEDGYYHEGVGYWSYALHWHVRAADLLSRATGEKMFDLPALRDNWNFALQMSLPMPFNAYDIGDAGIWTADNVRPHPTMTNLTMLWGIASALGSKESQLAGNFYYARHPEVDYPASAFLWFNPSIKAASLDDIKPYHYFPDLDVIAWRSGWKPESTSYLFRCGPPLGHRAAAKLGQMQDWVMNLGHVHADIGAFWMYAKGAYMAVGTGYTAEKWTRDQNTLLIDGKGQAADGEYHNDRGIPYADLDQAHIDTSYLGDTYGYASGEFGSSYNHQVTGVKLRRSVLMTERWLLIIDDMKSDKDHKLTWLCHTDGAFQAEGPAYVAHLPQASLAVLPLGSTALDPVMDATTVMAGMAPGKGTLAKHGYYLGLTMKQAAPSAHLIYLLVPLGAGEKLPAVEPIKEENNALLLSMKWPDGKSEKVRLDLAWKGEASAPSAAPGPATITIQ